MKIIFLKVNNCFNEKFTTVSFFINELLTPLFHTNLYRNNFIQRNLWIGIVFHIIKSCMSKSLVAKPFEWITYFIYRDNILIWNYTSSLAKPDFRTITFSAKSKFNANITLYLNKSRWSRRLITRSRSEAFIYFGSDWCQLTDIASEGHMDLRPTSVTSLTVTDSNFERIGRASIQPLVSTLVIQGLSPFVCKISRLHASRSIAESYCRSTTQNLMTVSPLPSYKRWGLWYSDGTIIPGLKLLLNITKH